MDTMNQFSEAVTKNMETFVKNNDSYTKMWSDFTSRLATAGMSFSPTSTPPEAARQVRGATLKAMAESTEDYMRSPQFLESMRQTMDQTLDFRKQFDDFLTQLHHQTQGVAREDVDSLMLSIRHLEMRMLNRMEDLTARLEAIDRRLDALNSAKADDHTARKRTTAPRQPVEAQAPQVAQAPQAQSPEENGSENV